MSHIGDAVVNESTAVLQPDDLMSKRIKNGHPATKVRDCTVIMYEPVNHKIICTVKYSYYLQTKVEVLKVKMQSPTKVQLEDQLVPHEEHTSEDVIEKSLVEEEAVVHLSPKEEVAVTPPNEKLTVVTPPKVRVVGRSQSVG